MVVGFSVKSKRSFQSKLNWVSVSQWRKPRGYSHMTRKHATVRLDSNNFRQWLLGLFPLVFIWSFTYVVALEYYGLNKLLWPSIEGAIYFAFFIYLNFTFESSLLSAKDSYQLGQKTVPARQTGSLSLYIVVTWQFHFDLCVSSHFFLTIVIFHLSFTFSLHNSHPQSRFFLRQLFKTKNNKLQPSGLQMARTKVGLLS